MDNAPVVVTVHGTYARHRLMRLVHGERGWWRAGSSFCRVLGAKIPGCSFVEFKWSGRNSHADRLAAGEELAKLLARLREREPRRPLCVAAHSHGGNVALKAVDAAPAGSVSHLFLLGTPLMSVVCEEPVPCDPEVEGTRHPCGGSTRHWLYRGDAAGRVACGVWMLYSPHDQVQVRLASLLTGIASSRRRKFPGKLEVQHCFEPVDARIKNVALDLQSELRVGLFGRLIGWDKIKLHDALHSRRIAEIIACVVTTGEITGGELGVTGT